MMLSKRNYEIINRAEEKNFETRKNSIYDSRVSSTQNSSFFEYRVSSKNSIENSMRNHDWL